MAGGLDPALEPGDLVIPTEIVTEDGTSWALSANLSATISAGTHYSPLLGVDHMVLDAAAKSDLYKRTGAAAIDMETHRVARVAAGVGLPVIAIRAIGDPAGRDLPRLVTRAISADGRPRIGPVIADLLRRPRDFRALLRVKRDTDLALRALTGNADLSINTIITAI